MNKKNGSACALRIKVRKHFFGRRVFVEKGGGKEDKNLMQKSLFSRRKGHQNWLTSYVNDSEPLFKVLINHKITRTCRIVGLGGTWSHFRFFGNFYHLFQFFMTPPL